MARSSCLKLLFAVGVAVSLAACANNTQETSSRGSAVSIKKSAVWVKKKPTVRVSSRERDCLARAMYFESNRSSPEGMLAVGSVVMNRYESGRYGDTICSVVGAPRQFAPGVLSRAMNDRSAPMARQVADFVLDGERHVKVSQAKHFHQAGLRFPYPNMHYVTVAGGNAFYEKVDRREREAGVQVASQESVRRNSVEQSVVTRVASLPSETRERTEAVVSRDVVQTASIEPLVQQAVNQPVPVYDAAPAATVVSQLAPLPPQRPKVLSMSTTPTRVASLATRGDAFSEMNQNLGNRAPLPPSFAPVR